MLEFTLTAAASILFVVDPLGVVPAYLVMTEGDTAAQRRAMAWKAAVAATATLLLFSLAGGYVISMFGVSLPAFRIAGGLILLLVALDMVKAQRSTQEGPAELAEGTEKADIAMTPLAIPMLAGPAALSTVTMLMNQSETWVQSFIVVGIIIATGLVIFLTLRGAELLHRLLGRTGIHVLSRIMGLVLLALAVQFILDGWREFGLA